MKGLCKAEGIIYVNIYIYIFFTHVKNNGEGEGPKVSRMKIPNQTLLRGKAAKSGEKSLRG